VGDTGVEVPPVLEGATEVVEFVEPVEVVEFVDVTEPLVVVVVVDVIGVTPLVATGVVVAPPPLAVVVGESVAPVGVLEVGAPVPLPNGDVLATSGTSDSPLPQPTATATIAERLTTALGEESNWYHGRKSDLCRGRPITVEGNQVTHLTLL
jgi:hypothetical protein